MQAIANFEHVDKTASEPLKPTKDLHYNRVFAAELAEAVFSRAYVPQSHRNFCDLTPDEVRAARNAFGAMRR